MIFVLVIISQSFVRQQDKE